ncbi:MAG: CARDB domain-containing protein, partial [Candidatus Thermoplasmatota archaeon]|nr:CARDB domain-containing protein [Candidatus Thermoplasmatota archaeon]
GLGDLRITAWDEGTPAGLVASNEVDHGLDLADVGDDPVGFGDENVFVEGRDAFYFNGDLDESSGLEDEDVRLTPDSYDPFADMAPQGKPSLTVTDLQVPSRLEAGAPFQLTVLVENSGDGAGNGVLETRIGETMVDARGTPTLAPDETATLVITLPAPSEPGEVTLQVNEKRATTTVEATPAEQEAPGASQEIDLSAYDERIEQLEKQVSALTDMVDGIELASTDQAPVETSANDTPSVGPLAILAGLGAVAFLARRRL